MKKYFVIGNPIEHSYHQNYIIFGLKKKKLTLNISKKNLLLIKLKIL